MNESTRNADHTKAKSCVSQVSALYEKHYRPKWQVVEVIDTAVEFLAIVGAMWKARNIHYATSRGVGLYGDPRVTGVAGRRPMENRRDREFRPPICSMPNTPPEYEPTGSD